MRLLKRPGKRPESVPDGPLADALREALRLVDDVDVRELADAVKDTGAPR